MRTTLTLDEDVTAKLRAEERRTGLPFKQVVNNTLRAGLNSQSRSASAPRFKIKARAWGSAGFNYDNVWEIIEQLEGPYYR